MAVSSRDSKIHLMAFEPRSDVQTIVHTVGMPPSLQEALFELLPPYKEGGYLGTNRLKEDLRCWLDQAVELRKVRRGCQEDAWLVALEPVDLERFCNVVSAWVASEAKVKKRDGLPAYGRVMDLLIPQTFEPYTEERRVTLFDEQGRPSKESGDLAFSAFAAQVAGALAGKNLLLENGESVNFNRVAGGTERGYELISDVRWRRDDRPCKDGCRREDEPWAFALKFHLETLPIGRRARLNLDVEVRRFIVGKAKKYLRLEKNVNAYVRCGDAFRVVPYGFVSNGYGKGGHLRWIGSARENYRFMSGRDLPDVPDYLDKFLQFAHEKSEPQILSPYSTSASSWAKEPSVASGVSVIDKALFFEAVAKELSDYVVPAEPLESVHLANLTPVFVDSDADVAQHEAWAASNRRRLAACTGESSVLFQVIGSVADEALLQQVKQEIVAFLGEEGERDGLDVRIEVLHRDELLVALGSGGVKACMGRITGEMGNARGLTACVVVLPGPKRFKELSRRGPSLDPKQAIRFGLARTDRLAQFLDPEGDNLEHRTRTAVRDLMRQLGFVREFAPGGKRLDLELPVVGLCVHGLSAGRKRFGLPLAVRMEVATGAVLVDCPLIPEGPLPYWRFELELARQSMKDDFSSAAERRANGAALMRMIDGIVADAMDSERLLLVRSYGLIRRRDWWPGISDAGLACGTLSYGPNGEHAAFERELNLQGSKLQILRVRLGADGEVPDYYTDPAGTKENEQPKRRTKQGLFVTDGYVLGLTARPNDKMYTRSNILSQFDRPTERFCEKTLNEYRLVTSDDMDLAVRYARYAEALRANMVQLYKSDMRVNLPAPLHLADALKEYIWGQAN